MALLGNQNKSTTIQIVLLSALFCCNKSPPQPEPDDDFGGSVSVQSYQPATDDKSDFNGVLSLEEFTSWKKSNTLQTFGAVSKCFKDSDQAGGVDAEFYAGPGEQVRLISVERVLPQESGKVDASPEMWSCVDEEFAKILPEVNVTEGEELRYTVQVPDSVLRGAQ